MRIFIIVFFNFFTASILYAPPLQRGGLKCQKFLYICENKNAKECIKHTNWALALTANIGDNKVGFKKNEFYKILYKSCKINKNMFIENLATILDLKNEQYINKKSNR